jgi:lipopolysaccharide transport system ATP-binding protein
MLVNSEAYIYTYSVYFERPAFNVRFGMLIKTVRGIEIGGHISAQPHKGIEYIDRFSRFRISFYWRCLLNPGAYFLNAGVLGIVNDNEIYLDRNIDVSMFRVQNNNNNNSTAIVNFVKSVEFEKI